MTDMEIKTWLGRYREGRRQMDRLRENRARAKSFGEKITVSFGGARGGRADKIQLAVERVAQIDEEIAALKKDLPIWQNDAETVIRRIANPDHRQAMLYYYVECLTWADTAELAGYGHRYLRDLHKKIIAEMDL